MDAIRLSPPRRLTLPISNRWGDGGMAWAFAGAGYAGALSTWSTLAREVGELSRTRSWWAVGYPVLTIVTGMSAAGLTIGGA